MEQFHGYIYITWCLQENKCYVGQCSKLPDKSRYYLGSGKLFKCKIKKYGKQFFKKIILGEIFSNNEQDLQILLNEAETECIYFFRAYGADGENHDHIYGYNLTKEGGTQRGFKHSEESIKQMKLKKKLNPSRPMKNKKHKKESLELISLNHRDCKGDKNPNFNKGDYKIWVEKYGIEEANKRLEIKKEKCRKGSTGRKRNQETIKKLSESKIKERNPNFKITDEMIVNIQTDLNLKQLKQSVIARKYNISPGVVSCIKNNKYRIK